MKQYIKDKLKKMFKEELEGLESQIQGLEKSMMELIAENKEHQKKIDDCNLNLQTYAINLKNNNEELKAYREQFKLYQVNIKNNNEELKIQKEQYELYQVNLRNNNKQLSEIEKQAQTIQKQFFHFEKALIELQKQSDEKSIQSNVRVNEADVQVKAAKAEHALSDKDTYLAIDYLDFENCFRGSRELILERQKQYLPYFINRKKVLDIGCGRGEFLELMSREGIGATGVDTYYDFVAYCKVLGLNAVQDDGISYLRTMESVDGLFLGQVIEHLSYEQILEICHLSYEKLEEGAYLVMETPNPTSLSIYANSFYMDPSHMRPIHPKTIEYCLKKSGFIELKIVYTEESKEADIPELELNDVTGNLYEFNRSMQRVSKLLFSSGDYAIIAKKPTAGECDL